MTVTNFATLSNIDLAIAEVQGKVKVTRLETVKPRSSDLILSQTKGNRCRTNRSSGTNFVTSISWVANNNSPGQDYKLPQNSFSTLCFFIMSKSVILSLLAQGNTGDEILSILDNIVEDIEQENINSCAEVFAA